MTTTEILAPLVSYNNGSYRVSILTDGTKIRTKIDSRNFVEFPESIDIKITNWCNAGCLWCHENSTISGTHADISYLKDLVSSLPNGVELAIGGGHPMAHPQFEEFLLFVKKQGMIANVTINQVHYKNAYERLHEFSQNKLIYGIGLSIKSLIPDYVLPNMVYHVIVGVHDPAWVYKAISMAFQFRPKLLILGYKTHGRGETFLQEPSIFAKKWIRYLPILAEKCDIAFDTLGIEQLQPKNLFLSQEYYQKFFMGEEGDFSMYIDAVERKYALSSYSKIRHDIVKNIPESFKDLQHG